MTLLSMIQNCSRELAITAPSSVVGSSDEGVLQMLQLANREGKQLAMNQWPQLILVATITTVASQTEYSLPSDFNWQIPDTMWDEGQRWPVQGPLTPQMYQAIQSGLVNSAPVGTRYLIRRATSGNVMKVYLDPTPAASSVSVPYQYYSLNWCTNTGRTTTYAAWNADTDLGLLPEDLMEMGIIWRWRRAKGFDWSTEYQEYRAEVGRRLGQVRPSPVISLVPARGARFLGPWNLPETGYGS